MTKPIHVGISNPTQNQKVIIESAISLIEIHKHLEQIKKIRREKIKQRGLLFSSFKELNNLFNQLEFPEIEEHKEHKPIKIHIKKEAKKEKPQPRKISKLEKDLQELKRKLRKIQ